MPISTKCLIGQSNSCLAGTPSELNLAQIAGIKSANTLYSVANIAALPSAELNKGRMIFVEDISAYRYSNGTEWTNSYDSTFAITSTQLWASGSAFNGQLANNGYGGTVNRSSPIQEITSSTNWCSAAAARFWSAGLKTDGTIWGWGCNRHGQLGTNDIICYSSPVQEITSSTNWTRMCGAGYQIIATKSDNSLWMWGDNGYGALGNNAAVDSSSPVREATLSANWCSITMGTLHTAHAIKTDGTLWGWGVNTWWNGDLFGAVGNNSEINVSSPVQEISSSTNWCKVSGGRWYAAAMKIDGSIWAWGDNSCGALGDGTLNCSSSPIQEITSSTDWIDVSSGRNHTYALKSNGTAFGWGSCVAGRLASMGICSFGTASSPVQETTSSTNWCVICAGDCSSFGIKTDNSLWGWGNNGYGLLMINESSFSNVSSPTQVVPNDYLWCGIYSTCRHSIALRVTGKGFNEP